jgi:hypothetical protein
VNQYISLAKLAVETYVKKGQVLKNLPQDLPKEFLERKAGVFVSISRSPRGTDAEQKRRTDAEKELRGCIGTYLATQDNIAKELIQNAVAAASNDPRFKPVVEDELSQISYTVYILGGPESVKDLQELNPKRYGIIVKSRDFPSKTGLLLPDLEQVDTVEQQFFTACQKAGIDPKKEEIVVYRFKAEKYE